MTTREFILIYVAVPLAIALGWLVWRGRYFLRNVILYALAVGVLLAVVRLGHLTWSAWNHWSHAVTPVESAPVCIKPGVQIRPGGSCWT